VTNLKGLVSRSESDIFAIEVRNIEWERGESVLCDDQLVKEER